MDDVVAGDICSFPLMDIYTDDDNFGVVKGV